MKRIALALASLSFASAAFAGTSVKSEYFYQTEKDKQQVTPYLNYTSQKAKMTGFSRTEAGQTLNVQYEYGLNEMMSLGATVGYLSSTTEATSSTNVDNKGLTDITFMMKGNKMFVEGSSFHFGTELAMSMGDSEVNNDKNEQNAMSGGYALRPWAGYQWMMGKAVTGVKMSTGFDLTKRNVKTTTTGVTTKTKDTGGIETAMTGFYEMPYDKWILGASFSYINMNTTKSDSNGTTTTRAGGNLWKLKASPTYMLSETATILGELSYSTLASSKFATTMSSVTETSMQVGGRFTF